MRGTIWGAVLVLCCFVAGQAEAGVFDCHQDECTCAAPSYCASTPYYYGSTYSPYMYGDCCQGYYDECDDECCFQRCWRRLWDLEHRKNNWLKRTFLGGCGDDDNCHHYSHGYEPACGGVYYAPSAPGCCNGY